MTHVLPQVAHEHHERLLSHVNQMPDIADALLDADGESVRGTVQALSAFLTGTLLPHVEAAETTLYPVLERLFQNRHSMSPMRREHAEVRRLVGEFAHMAETFDPRRHTIGRTLAIRRVMFQLYSLLKVHIAEEELYLRIVDQGVATDIGDLLAAAMEHPGIRPA